MGDLEDDGALRGGGDRQPTRTATPKTAEVETLRREIERLHVLGSSNRLIDAVLEQSPHGIIICDARGKLIMQNRAAERIWAGSATAEGVDAWNQYRAFHPDGRPFETGDWSMVRCLNGRQAVAAEEIHIQRFDGTFGFLLGSCAPIFDPDGNLQGAVSVFADITPFKHAANRSSRLQLITAELSQALTPAQVAEVVVEQSVAELKAATAGLWLLSAGDEFIELVHNAGYSAEGKIKFSRIPVRSSMRLPVLDTMAGAHAVWLTCREEFAAQYPEVAAGVPPRSEYAIASLPLMVHGRCIGALAFTFDARRAFDSEERGFLTVLARHCAQALDRARLFEAEQRARAEAEAAARTREEVLAVVSHDLRNPLGVIMMNVVTLARLHVEDAKVGARLKQNVDSIRRSAERMSRMIGDLLDLASIEAGQLSIERSAFSPAEIASTAAETFAPMAEERQVQVVTDIASDCPPIQCDRDRVIQVFTNLLSNAVKVTAAGGRVTVAASRADDDDVVFSVRDTGHGIAPEDLPRLFERFYRGQQAHYKGTGLGLTIAKGIVDAHGGRMWVESKVGEGATFFFRIPINPPPTTS
ncbi:MAG TPA: ATP-binding protein [Polyangia bacterium]|nr:ATP-binding protein [Polyangia bacterium]